MLVVKPLKVTGGWECWCTWFDFTGGMTGKQIYWSSNFMHQMRPPTTSQRHSDTQPHTQTDKQKATHTHTHRHSDTDRHPATHTQTQTQ